MKSYLLISALFALGISTNTLGATTNIKYDGTAVTKEIRLTKDDTVVINTTVPVNTKFMVSIKLKKKSPIEIANFNFESSVVAVTPYRQGEFVDRIFAGANPGSVTYTFTGKNDSDAVVSVFP
ncbi:MAG: hypothetical protein M3R00_01695 [Pseudomonadota bacterium]|nr:hypothetical protein [Pseudomonadota bacterium]